MLTPTSYVRWRPFRGRYPVLCIQLQHYSKPHHLKKNVWRLKQDRSDLQASRVLPSAFVDRMRAKLGNVEAERLFKSIMTEPAVPSIRLNPSKHPTIPIFTSSDFDSPKLPTDLSADDAADVDVNADDAAPLDADVDPEGPESTGSRSTEELGEAVPWFAQYGRILPRRPLYQLNPLLNAGVFYPQDASSMLFPQSVPVLQTKSARSDDPLVVLDLCAAPGGKTGVIASLLDRSNSVIVSNEIVGQRAAVLEEILSKTDLPGSAITQNRSSDFIEAGLEETFDVVIVDAPCSGEGLFRRELSRSVVGEAIQNWSPNLVRQLSRIQKTLLDDAVRLVRPGGTLVFMTCTLETEENEDNVKWIWSRYGSYLEPNPIPMASNWGVVAVEVPVSPGDSAFQPEDTIDDDDGESDHDLWLDDPSSSEPLPAHDLEEQPSQQEQEQHPHHPVYYCLPHRVRGEGLFLASFTVKAIPPEIREHLPRPTKTKKKSRSAPTNAGTRSSATANSSSSSSGDDKHRSLRRPTRKEWQQCKDYIRLDRPQDPLGAKYLPLISTYIKPAREKSGNGEHGREGDGRQSAAGMPRRLVHLVPASVEATLTRIAYSGLQVRKLGVVAGEIQNDRFVPSAELALSPFLRKGQVIRSQSKAFAEEQPTNDQVLARSDSSHGSTIPSETLLGDTASPFPTSQDSRGVWAIELDRQQSLYYLQKKPIPGIDQIVGQHNLQSWGVVSYGGCGLGWIRVIDDGKRKRVNQHYPTEWRIRKNLGDLEDIR
ncbi:S-adenosyl-L-methionine-dependent methyltransferase [Polychytrium aggregatum]|uniref:S-adenosyl-L-methionine-dependent methyltransferase n=1 Tax=Polychytrium aggregatum TaxID=110093 RepID=UPI0022FEE6A2|nr:S-adenosyl-L-methionine-dependent methyltransferase [Polychytrium aggregatum]KAI9207988.1 S-adenosyl-L-methionine-dependent methyltransferase [Polychytrium aggregatum]